MSDAPFTITIYDRALARRGWIGAPAKVECTIRHNAVGQTSVTIPADHPRISDIVAPGARSSIAYRDHVVMTGRIARVEGTGPRSAASVTFHVEDDFRLLNRLLGWPNPAGPLTAQGDDGAYDTVTGPAETVVKTLIARNAGRSLPTITVAGSAGRGSTITTSMRMHPLADRLLPAVDLAGIGITVRHTGTVLVVDCYQPVTRPMILSEESGVVVGWSWTSTAPSATRVVVGGQGEGTARTFIASADNARETEWGETVEVFRDARDVEDSNAAVLAQRAQETLDEGAPTTGLSLTLSESRGYAYGRSVRVGDKVTTQIAPGAAITDVLREANLVWDVETGLTVTPVVGERQDDPSTMLRSTINALAKGIRDLRTR